VVAEGLGAQFGRHSVGRYRRTRLLYQPRRSRLSFERCRVSALGELFGDGRQAGPSREMFSPAERAGPRTRKAPATRGLSRCAEEGSSVHPVIPDQALKAADT
jgi:hypothetical protein